MSRMQAKADVTGSVWKITTAVGQQLEPGDAVMILESMKMEIPVIAEEGGRIVEFRVDEGESVVEGQVVAILEG